MSRERGVLKTSSAANTPRTFVLVHGAWHGGWCWRRVAEELRARGHRVFTPSLTGLGDRAHLFSQDISLQTHVQDILEVVETEELNDFVLVGHSYGGFVISGVADTLRERVSHYVYLDASVPPDMSPGASFSWAGFNPPEAREARLQSVREQGQGVALPAPPPGAFGDQTCRRCLAATALAAHAGRDLYRELSVQAFREQWIKAHLHCGHQPTLCFAGLYPEPYSR